MKSVSHPDLKTDRLLLRSLKPADEDDLLILRSDDRVNFYLDREKKPTPESVRAWMEKIRNNIEKGGTFYWAICLQNSDTLIGTICLFNYSEEHKSLELGFELHPDFQGKGIMKEAAKRVINFSFKELNVAKLEAWVHHENLASRKLLESFKFLIDNELEELNKALPELKILRIYSLSISHKS